MPYGFAAVMATATLSAAMDRAAAIATVATIGATLSLLTTTLPLVAMAVELGGGQRTDQSHAWWRTLPPRRIDHARAECLLLLASLAAVWGSAGVVLLACRSSVIDPTFVAGLPSPVTVTTVGALMIVAGWSFAVQQHAGTFTLLAALGTPVAVVTLLYVSLILTGWPSPDQFRLSFLCVCATLSQLLLLAGIHRCRTRPR